MKKEKLFLILIVFFILVPKLGNPCGKMKIHCSVHLSCSQLSCAGPLVIVDMRTLVTANISVQHNLVSSCLYPSYICAKI